MKADGALLIDLRWPPWFAVSLWKWCATLGWPDGPPFSPDGGITYLELLVNYVVVTGCLPPAKCGKGSYVDLCSDDGRLRPFKLADVTLTFVGAVRSLAKATGLQPWPAPQHHRIRSLTFCTEVVRTGKVWWLVLRFSLPKPRWNFCAQWWAYSRPRPFETLRLVVVVTFFRLFKGFLLAGRRPKTGVPTRPWDGGSDPRLRGSQSHSCRRKRSLHSGKVSCTSETSKGYCR